jgi:aspartyl-tRNA(Asn)/glutamyl-tRNA(Gln) amidotransferase subunit C
MSAISRDEVAHLAALARIDLRPAELDRLAGQLGQILDAVATVREVAGDDVPATSHPMPLTNVTRPDQPRPCLSADEALAGAPAVAEQRFRVPRILEED